MIKLVYCITKKAGLTDEKFFRYWKDIRGPIGARIPRLRKLVQSRRLAARQSPEWKLKTRRISSTGKTYFISEEQIILDRTEQNR